MTIGESQAVSDDLIRAFRKRAKILKLWAVFALALILVSLASGITIFVFADSITQYQSSTALTQLGNTLSQISQHTAKIADNIYRLSENTKNSGNDLKTLVETEKKWIQKYQYDLEEAFRRTDNFFKKNQNIVGVALKDKEINKELLEIISDIRKSNAEIMKRIPSAFSALEKMMSSNSSFFENIKTNFTQSSDSLKAIQGSFAEIDKMTKSITFSVGELIDSQKRNINQKEKNIDLIISTLATRIGSMFILIFLVQILVNLYRYNIRLAYFYDSRADSLEMARSGNRHDLKSLIELWSPDQLDFGRQPKSPAEYGFQLAQDWLKKTGK
jgi:hypothetical protein